MRWISAQVVEEIDVAPGDFVVQSCSEPVVTRDADRCNRLFAA